MQLQWNPTNLLFNGPQNSGHITQGGVLMGFFKGWFSAYVSLYLCQSVNQP